MDLLIVDSYSNDLPWHMIMNFLDYALNFGTIEDIDFFEKCLKQKNYSSHKRTTKTLAEIENIHNWEQEQVLKSMVKNKVDSIRHTLENIQIQINVQKYMSPYLEEIESKMNKSIKNIIIENCDYFLTLNKNYKKDNHSRKITY